jgi:ABC-type sugar transport system ATPase subunit
VIWSSSDLAEVAQHSDRILVVAGGRLVAELPAGSTVQEILDHAFAARSDSDRTEADSAKRGQAS